MHQTYQSEPEECGKNLCFFILQNRTGIKMYRCKNNLYSQTHISSPVLTHNSQDSVKSEGDVGDGGGAEVDRGSEGLFVNDLL